MSGVRTTTSRDIPVRRTKGGYAAEEGKEA